MIYVVVVVEGPQSPADILVQSMCVTDHSCLPAQDADGLVNDRVAREKRGRGGAAREQGAARKSNPREARANVGRGQDTINHLATPEVEVHPDRQNLLPWRIRRSCIPSTESRNGPHRRYRHSIRQQYSPVQDFKVDVSARDPWDVFGDRLRTTDFRH